MDHLTHNDLVEGAHLHDVLKLFVHVTQSKLTCVEGVREYVGCVEGVREWDVQECGCDVWKE